MEQKLLELSVTELLKKFGAGEHKPGSGSAAAMQAMLSAQLIKTVISLSTAEKRLDRYGQFQSKFISIERDINDNIFPELEQLFQHDSELFDKTIQVRLKRDASSDPIERFRLEEESRAALKPATSILADIADQSIKLGDYASDIFTHGFRSARGDSSVAFNGTVSAIGGCLAIIQLNMGSLHPDDWYKEMMVRVTEIKSHYERLSPLMTQQMSSLEKETSVKQAFQEKKSAFVQGFWHEPGLNNSTIEQVARDLQNFLWIHKKEIWKKNTPDKLLEILDPGLVIRKVMGFDFKSEFSLGINPTPTDLFEVAGLVDRNERVVKISQQFSTETQRFTAAHELGHLLFHPQTVLHRDRPLDGSSSNASRTPVELQADTFASVFLMPSKLVTGAVEQLFGVEVLTFDDATALSLRTKSLIQLRRQCPSKRHFSRLIASTDYFAGKSFKSLSQIFQVSIETMAIRLEELSIIDYRI